MRTTERYARRTRWLHAAIYLLTFLLLATGAWLLLGKEGTPSALARIASTSDVVLHERLGWALSVVAAAGIAIGWRGSLTYVADSVHYDRADAAWLARWPRAAFSGRFGHHEGHFDPGQKIANLVLAALLIALIASGAGLALVGGGTAFVVLLKVHRWSTYALTPVVVGHVIVASGIVPGYRGVWRSMHWRGRVPEDTARRLWPAWAESRFNPAPTSLPRNPRTD